MIKIKEANRTSIDPLYVYYVFSLDKEMIELSNQTSVNFSKNRLLVSLVGVNLTFNTKVYNSMSIMVNFNLFHGICLINGGRLLPILRF